MCSFAPLVAATYPATYPAAYVAAYPATYIATCVAGLSGLPGQASLIYGDV